MIDIPNEFPKLIDSSAGHALYNTLLQCHDNRLEMYSKIFNVTIVVIFILAASFILYWCFQRKKTQEEIRNDIYQHQKYILEKIKSLELQKQNYYEENSMTHLPVVTNMH